MIFIRGKKLSCRQCRQLNSLLVISNIKLTHPISLWDRVPFFSPEPLSSKNWTGEEIKLKVENWKLEVKWRFCVAKSTEIIHYSFLDIHYSFHFPVGANCVRPRETTGLPYRWECWFWKTSNFVLFCGSPRASTPTLMRFVRTLCVQS